MAKVNIANVWKIEQYALSEIAYISCGYFAVTANAKLTYIH
jgi:hypothetical protein